MQLMAALALVQPGWAGQRSAVNRALGAALAEFQEDPAGYRAIYQEYLGVQPLLVPRPVPEAWPAASELKSVLERGELRLGYCYNPPYHFTGLGGADAGLDYDLGLALMPALRARYGSGLRLRWVEKRVGKPSGDDQADIYARLIEGLQAGEFDAALSGLLIIPGKPVVWTCPSSLLFTGIFYTGKDSLPLQPLKGGTRQQLLEWLAGHQDREYTFMATQNPGPSSSTNQALVDEVVALGGKARAVPGTVPELQAALRQAPVHFVVGDAVSLSYFCNRPDFQGVNLNMPATEPVNSLQLAPFTL